ncbi:MAG: MerR family DNA-binding protein [Oceanicaulis sp.]
MRYYEQNRLMAEPERAASGHLRYDGAALERLGFIRQARELDFDLSLIRALLDLAADPDRPCAAVDTIAQRHVDAIAGRIARVTALKGALERVLHACAGERVGDRRVL